MPLLNIKREILIIEDDHSFHMILKKTFFALDPNLTIHSFFDGLDAIEYVRDPMEEDERAYKSIILLDLTMPILDGWGFLDLFHNLPKSIKEHYTIFIVSSSINKSDRDRALTYDCVKNYYSKPLLVADFNQILKSCDEAIE
ncbi:response regulator [Algoriphagus hitonicola]|uniref:CheY chemotaxis protein or a CheY-like REC (Receiver) domain n=1 Tax=Algoriphagus hitonicola TaxID=435880 RepID=A0A1I2T119_9BACT|nr:response regulator [Algoriphagus hitonicola]SFG58603.1 CheY chemotaxis protein or a CheY-like REC (receiver) domain [Algoriphagus hitonicola]